MERLKLKNRGTVSRSRDVRLSFLSVDFDPHLSCRSGHANTNDRRGRTRLYKLLLNSPDIARPSFPDCEGVKLHLAYQRVVIESAVEWRRGDGQVEIATGLSKRNTLDKSAQAWLTTEGCLAELGKERMIGTEATGSTKDYLVYNEP